MIHQTMWKIKEKKRKTEKRIIVAYSNICPLVWRNHCLARRGPGIDPRQAEWRGIWVATDFLSTILVYSLYRSPNIVRVIKSRRLGWAGHVTRMEESAFKMITGKSTGKRSLGRPRRTILE